MDKATFQSFLLFFAICLAIFSTIGAPAYLFYYGNTLFGVVCLLFSVIAIVKVYLLYKKCKTYEKEIEELNKKIDKK